MFRGNMFEFFRNTGLDARNYFSPERAEFNQNQPGGTLGGPLRHGKIFFFGDYQATRTTQGIETGNISVPSLLNRGGNFSDIADDLDGVVNGPSWANVLSQRLGYNVRSGEAYYTPACATTAQCVFPGAVIPQRAWSSPARQLLPRVPSPNVGDHELSTGAFAQTVRDDKGSLRIDGNTKLLGLLTGYYFVDDYTLDNPYPGQQGGANVPGFDAQTIGRAQLWTLSSGRTFGPNTVNDFHTMGVTITGVNQTGDTLHLSDSLSKVYDRTPVNSAGSISSSRCGSSRTRRSTARSRSPARKPDPISRIS